MNSARSALMLLACSAAMPAFAQNPGPNSGCGATNYDPSRGVYTIVTSTPGALNQQCFINVIPKTKWPGGAPDPATSNFVEGNYNIVLSGGGGGAGGSAEESGHGYDGADAVVFKGTRYLSPGVYRLTIGTGGKGGEPCLTDNLGGRGGDGAPSSIAEAYTGQLIAGYPGAEYWNGRSPQSYAVATTGRVPALSPDVGNMLPSKRYGQLGGGGHSVGPSDCHAGANGGDGFIRLALADTPPPAAQPVQPQPPAAAPRTETPPPAPVYRPRRDRM